MPALGGEERVGAASVGHALVRGFAPDPRSPAGKTLLETYRDHLQRQQAAVKEAVDLDALRDQLQQVARQLSALQKSAGAVETPEARARRKGAKATVKTLKRGGTVEVAVAAGHARYKRHGGKLAVSAWRKAELQGL